MKAIILAGGLGTRISEETHLKPKPMVEIGGMPILWHVMKIYSSHGVNDFIICCGYKGYVIKEYFTNYFLHQSDVTLDLQKNEMKVHRKGTEPWKVTLIDTGQNTMTGGRLKRVFEYVKNDKYFFFTYGDGVGNIDITQSLNFHKSHGKMATMTGVFPPGRFGSIILNNEQVIEFEEKPKGDGRMVNGGFFVLSPKVFSYIKDDSTIWEQEPLKNLAKDGELFIHKHLEFWKPMDTLRDKLQLEELWNSKKAPWKIW